ncbi:D-alanyl-D-alanine carboxypeptidase family protein [Clostridium sp. BJN0001]|uniref:D-alanyl-D-alanine carboxypeptidase family protein n=1 Tax=Clostridium sp. BJN0001 TaxID=2930219 RepID=UPI001FD57037|nr:D-alanyl-D-alanine carboxypeptidase family protein [Clostridium sp. BJN0001]
MRKIIKSISLIIIGILIFELNSTTVFAKASGKTFRVNARCAIAMDKDTHKILYQQNAHEIVPMASTTKILTSLIAIEQGDPNKKVTISKNASSVRGSKVGYKAGEEISLKELIFGLMFRSGNDAAVAIAESLGGSVENFAEIMNHYARGIGILDSHFETPHGLDKNEHYSTAYDLAILTSKGMDNKFFREVVGSKEIKKEKYNFTRDYSNINKILWKIPGANGVKTGYTGGAGKCLVSSVNKDGKDIIIVVLNCPDRWNVTEKIYKHVLEVSAFESLNIKELI